MARLKIDYGIDLGTTNSAICRMDKGEVIIIKSDTSKDIMPSCVSVTKRKTIKVGETAYNDMKSDKRRATKNWAQSNNNTFTEFKRKMGTDEVLFSSYLDKDFKPEELSAEVLKTLKSFVTDEQIRSVVITVPAMFKVNQKDATMRAAKLAGFEHCELLQEPIAAAMAYGVSSNQKNGYWLVFDFGGGTFDAALLKVEDGIMQVFDTEGNNYLGGKNLDYAIVDKMIIPYFQEHYSIDNILSDSETRDVLREAAKTYAEEVKNQLSFKSSEDVISNLGDLGVDDEGEELEIDMSITQEQLREVVAPIFQEAIDLCKKLLERNNMSGDKLDKIILVGGPTHSPILREMLKEQLTPNVDSSIDPMSAVASGAALYASTLDSEVQKPIDVGTLPISLAYESTSVEEVELVTVKIDESNAGSIPAGRYSAEIIRSDGAWSSGRFKLTYQGDVIDCYLVENKSNSFSVTVYDEFGNVVPCEPNIFTIIQGSKIGSAILPYNIGIEVWNDVKEKAVFRAIKGLEKNKTLPAIGVDNGLHSSNDIRPGIEDDVMKIPIYQAGYDAEGLPAACFEYVYEVKLTGENLPALLPAGSEVDLTMKVDRSEQISVELYIPSLDHTEEVVVPRESIQKTVTDKYIEQEIDKARSQMNSLKEEGIDVASIEEELLKVETELENGDEKPQVLKHLRDTLQHIAKLDNAGEWERIEKKLTRDMKMLEEDNKKYGNPETTKQVENIKRQVNTAISKKNVTMGKELLEVMFSLNFKLAKVEYYIVWIADWDKRFDTIKWRSRTQARQLIDKGKSIIMNTPTAERLSPIVHDLIELIPNTEMPAGAEGLLTQS